jgi:SAM-dependent methyltransferase
MADQTRAIDLRYEQHYARRKASKVYPTEFVVRTFLADYPGLRFRRPAAGERVLDVGFGDGRNTVLLCDLGLAVSGIEITQAIVDQTAERLEALGHRAELRVGRNSRIPFDDQCFDYLLACHCCYYCDEGESFADNMAEYARVLKQAGYLVASVACRSSYIFRNAIEQPDGSFVITADPYGNRNGYRLQAFSGTREISEKLAPWFSNFSFGFADNDYYGITERVFWVVCQRK